MTQGPSDECYEPYIYTTNVSPSGDSNVNASNFHTELASPTSTLLTLVSLWTLSVSKQMAGYYLKPDKGN